MADYAYLHLLYDAWVAVMDKRPTGVNGKPIGIEFDILVQVCKSSIRNMYFPMHKMKSDPEHNEAALQLYYAVFPNATCYDSIKELLANHLQADRIAFHGGDQPKSKSKSMIIALSGPIGTGKTYTAHHIDSIASEMGIETCIKSFGYCLKVFCSEYLNFTPLEQCWNLSLWDYNADTQTYSKYKTEVPQCVRNWEQYGTIKLAPASYITDSILTIDPNVDLERIRNHLQKNLQAAFVKHKLAIEQNDATLLLTARRILQIVASVFRDLAGDDFWVSQLLENKNSILCDDRKPVLIIIDDMRFVNEAFWVKKEGGHLVYVDSPGMKTQGGAVGAHVSENSLDSTFADTIVINSHNGIDTRFADSMERIKNYLMQ